MSSTSAVTEAIWFSLTPARMETYDVFQQSIDRQARALELYECNAKIAAAFMIPLHVCEVVTRNAVSEALTHTYGHEWPASSTFRRSLPQTAWSYSARRDLESTCERLRSTSADKIVPELKFVFWESILAKRHHERVWSKQFQMCFANSDQPVSIARRDLAADLASIRRLRNRIAHHEPVFREPLAADYIRMQRVIGLRSARTLEWMLGLEDVTALLECRPA